MTGTMNDKPLPAILKKPHLWCFSTYFAEGFPYSIIRSVSTVFFRDRGVSLEAVGLTTFFGLPWILKFFWGPLVDEFATKHRWLLAMQAALAVLIGAAAFLVPLPGGVRLIAILFFAGAFVAATHDIAIDGYYLAALDKEEQTNVPRLPRHGLPRGHAHRHRRDRDHRHRLFLGGGFPLRRPAAGAAGRVPLFLSPRVRDGAAPPSAT